MKQKILLLAMALLGCMNVVKAADEADKVTIDEVTIKQNGYGFASFKISLNRQTKIPYDGAQIEFELPEGLSYNQFKIGSDATYSSPNGKFNSKDDGTSTFILMHMSTSPFYFSNEEKDSYEFLKIYFKADENMNKGDYKIKIDLRLSCVNPADETLAGDYNADDPNHYLDAQKEISVKIIEGGPRILSDESTVLPEDNYTYEVTTYEYDENGNQTDEKTEKTTVPEDFTINRTIKANTWSTLCLPFEMTEDDVEKAFGEEVSILVNDGWSYDAKNEVIDLLFYPPAVYNVTGIPANTPVLIKIPNTLSDFTVSQKILESDEEAAAQEIDNGQRGASKKTGVFQGVLKAGDIPAGSLFFSGNKFYYSTGNSSIKAFRAYLTLGDVLPNKNIGVDGAVNIGLLVNDTPTYIEGISTKYVGNDDVYSVSGIKMGTESDLNKMKPGMYIVNGKKVIVK